MAKPTKKVISAESGFIESIYTNVYSGFEFPKITTPGIISTMYNSSNGNTKQKSGEDKIKKNIASIKRLISQSMHALKEIDTSLKVTAYQAKNTKSEEYKTAKENINEKYTMRLMTDVDWAKLGKIFKNSKGEKCIRIGGKVYNITKSTLSTGGKNLKVNYYVPFRCRDLSKLNTMTLFAGSSYNFKKKGCSIVASVPQDYSSNKEYYNRIGDATKFMNSFAKTKTKCKNYIGGGSRFSQMSAMIASHFTNSKKKSSLYQGVIGVNFGLLVSDNKGKDLIKAACNQGAKRINQNDLKKMNGLVDFYFVENEGDQNEVTAPKSRSLVASTCPNSTVKLISKRSNKTEWNKMTIYDSSAPANNKRKGHSYQQPLYDAVFSGMFDKNGYRQ